MAKNVVIDRLDYFGRGIGQIDNKIVFVKNALPSEIVDVQIISSKKSYSEGIVTKYHKLSPKRIKSICPYFSECGGCSFLNCSYETSLNFKKAKIEELLTKNKINYSKPLEIIENPEPLNYRNKISLKILNGKIGYYENNTHNLVPITTCLIANPSINEMLKNYHLLHIQNGELTIRTNSNHEILLIIKSPETPHIDYKSLKNKVKLVGIVYNGKPLYQDDFFYERIDNKLFKVSFDAFFQVNPYITTKLFKLLSDNINESSKVLDLYSGVGTLSIVASETASEVYSIEIVKNAVLNGILNAKLNKRSNIKFMLGDVSQLVKKLKLDFDTLIIDPPRKGLDKNTIEFIKLKKPQKIIYISCDVATLMRDLKLLEEIYFIDSYKLLDMFSYTYHIESMCILKLK